MCDEKKSCCGIKGFFSRLFAKCDKKLEEKAKEQSCCDSDSKDDSSCCK
ncbi:MAG: hypothetical protein GY858_02665 [Candidatus Omnitrophica bacterium]|nr:hypothetical protein [Candidatus Omnitrophota bacterium]